MIFENFGKINSVKEEQLHKLSLISDIAVFAEQYLNVQY